MRVRSMLGAMILVAAAGCAGQQSEAETPNQTEAASGGQADPKATQTGAPLGTDDKPGIATDEPVEQDADWGIVDTPGYAAVVERVTGMVNDQHVVSGARRRGLDVVNVMWEDTGRAEGSALGPNISDLTLQVSYPHQGREQAALMPVIRFPNFTDRTGDIPADKFLIRVGNHRRSGKLRSLPLVDVLKDLRAFASIPHSIRGSGNLLARRDTHFLVSAQAVFLPIPKRGKAEFTPVVFNYQSAPGSPAVLTLLVTREGTSMTVIENEGPERSPTGWGQELYFNNHGQRARFTAERKSDVKARIAAQGGPKSDDDRSALERGADVLFLVQVPLKHRNRGALGGQVPAGVAMEASSGAGAPAASAPKKASRPRSDVEQAVLGHGRDRGPFSEGKGLRLERDPNFPIRVTVQFYKATSNGVVSEKDLDDIASSIGAVYEHADFVGSLVIPRGDPRRPTAWQRMPDEWFPW